MLNNSDSYPLELDTKLEHNTMQVNLHGGKGCNHETIPYSAIQPFQHLGNIPKKN
jgi:hypothetical protein